MCRLGRWLIQGRGIAGYSLLTDFLARRRQGV
jgi:hypothetical protein